MSQVPLDVVGIGNAIVDVIAHADEAFLEREALVKGTMALIDADRAEALYRMMGPAIEASGGSTANTMAGIASLGGNGAYIGKVRDDLLGEVFRHDLTAQGVRFNTPAATGGSASISSCRKYQRPIFALRALEEPASQLNQRRNSASFRAS